MARPWLRLTAYSAVSLLASGVCCLPLAVVALIALLREANFGDGGSARHGLSGLPLVLVLLLCLAAAFVVSAWVYRGVIQANSGWRISFGRMVVALALAAPVFWLVAVGGLDHARGSGGSWLPPVLLAGALHVATVTLLVGFFGQPAVSAVDEVADRPAVAAAPGVGASDSSEYCPRCGRKRGSEDAFCGGCGHRFAVTP